MDNTLDFHASHANISPRTWCQKTSPLFVAFVSETLTANKFNNGVESMRWEGSRDPRFQYCYCILGNVPRLIICTTSPSFLFYCLISVFQVEPPAVNSSMGFFRRQITKFRRALLIFVAFGFFALSLSLIVVSFKLISTGLG